MRAPNAHAYAQRVVRTMREECLDRLLVLRQYIAYYNERRPHQGLGQRPPAPTTDPPASPAVPARIQCHPVLGGIIHDYHLAA